MLSRPARRWKLLFAALLISVLIAGCDSSHTEFATFGKVDYLLVYDRNEPEIVLEVMGDLKDYMERMGAGSVKLLPMVETSWAELKRNADKGIIVLSGAWFSGQSMIDAAQRQGLSGDSFIVKARLDGGKQLIELWANDRRPRLFVVYHLLHLMGVRFFHPEEEHVPPQMTLPELPYNAIEKPIYKYRGFHLHRTHPVELLDDFDSTEPAAVKRARNYIKWLLKNKQNYCSGVGGTNPELAKLRLDMGCTRTGGLGLTNIQQGGKPLLTPTDPLEVNLKKIEKELEKRFADPKNIPELFGVGAGDTEVFNSDATKAQILDWMTFTVKWVHERYPEVYLLNNVHITKEEVIPELGVDLNLVDTLLPSYVNLKIHTVMFYGLNGPAPAYGHTSFDGRYKVIDEELTKGRRMWYYPESSWWLTFDNAIPLFLPIYIKMRWEDMQLLDPWISRGIDGHQTFTSGHEWGYWMIDYCIMRMSWAHKVDWKMCLTEITNTMGTPGDAVQKVIVEMGDYQKETLINRDLMRWVVGEDELAELGANTDKAAHVIRIPFTKLESWNLEQIAAFRKKDLADMLEMETTYKGYLDRLTDLADRVATPGRRIFDEVVDGTEINYLRARQIRLIYEGLLNAREAFVSGKVDLLKDAREKLKQAAQVTSDARVVIRRREKQYRYPLLLSIEGDRENPVPNRTTYPFRVQSDTHTLFFWTRRDLQAEESLTRMETRLVTVNDILTTRDKPVQLELSPLIDSSSTVKFGDGTSLSASQLKPHSYQTQGFYTLSVENGSETLAEVQLAVVERRYRFLMKSLTITSPKEAASTIYLIRGLLPDIFVGTGQINAFAHDSDKNGSPDVRSLLPLTANDGGFDGFDWDIALVGQNVTFFDLTLTVGERDGKPLLKLKANLDKDQLVRFIVQLGGHIEPEAIASILESVFPNPVIDGTRTLYPIEAELTGSE